jgi:hypothetical protein
MAWQTRGNSAYYYRSRREGGRVVRDYFGGGPEAELAAELDRRRRAERIALVAEAEADRERHATAARPLDELALLTDLLLDTTLAVAGYHRHDRGPWRKRRAKDRP